ncbi:MAG: SUMF1/EgtB/PvdO family nonheme iron enzyme [Prosthecobacter sp.]
MSDAAPLHLACRFSARLYERCSGILEVQLTSASQDPISGIVVEFRCTAFKGGMVRHQFARPLTAFETGLPVVLDIEPTRKGTCSVKVKIHAMTARGKLSAHGDVRRGGQPGIAILDYPTDFSSLNVQIHEKGLQNAFVGEGGINIGRRHAPHEETLPPMEPVALVWDENPQQPKWPQWAKWAKTTLLPRIARPWIGATLACGLAVGGWWNLYELPRREDEKKVAKNQADAFETERLKILEDKRQQEAQAKKKEQDKLAAAIAKARKSLQENRLEESIKLWQEVDRLDQDNSEVAAALIKIKELLARKDLDEHRKKVAEVKTAAEKANQEGDLWLAKNLWREVSLLQHDDARAAVALAELDKVLARVSLEVVPADALILCKDQRQVGGSCTLTLGLGEHEIQIERPGYHSITKKVLISNDKPPVQSFNLKRQAGSLSIDILPHGTKATIICQKSEIGSREEQKSYSIVSPAVLPNLPTGEYTVRAERTWEHGKWPSLERKIHIIPDSKKQTDHEFAEGSVRIESIPSGQDAMFYVITPSSSYSSQRLPKKGKTPWNIPGIPAGTKCRVVVQMENWPKFETKVFEVIKGENPVKAEFAEGTITLQSDPPGKKALFRGESGKIYGDNLTPLTVTKIPPGERYTALIKGGDGWSDFIKTDVHIEKGANPAITAEFHAGSLQINSDPPGEKFTLYKPKNTSRSSSSNNTGIFKEGTTPLLVENIPVGPGYRLVITKKGWPEHVVEDLNVIKGANPPATHRFGSGSLVISSDPPGMDFTLERTRNNYDESGTTFAVVTNIPAGGKYQLRIKREGWPSHGEIIAVTDGGTTTVHHVFRQGMLSIPAVDQQGTPLPPNLIEKVKIRVRDDNGLLPLTKVPLPAGRSLITFIGQDQMTHDRRVTIAADSEVTEMPTQVFGHFDIDSEPAGAEVWEGEAKLGVTPLKIPAALGQLVELKLKSAGFKDTVVSKRFFAATEDLPDRRVLAKLRKPGAYKTPEPGQSVKNSIGLKMIPCSPGKFSMGSPSNERPKMIRDGETVEGTRSNNEKLVKTAILETYWLSSTPVTRSQFDFIMGGALMTDYVAPQGESDESQEDDWFIAEEFCRRLTVYEQEKGAIPPGWAYRLPTEVEWEYACRAGTKTAYHWGDVWDAAKGGHPTMGIFYTESSLISGTENQTPSPRLPANQWGFHLMNAGDSEWCADLADPDDGYRVLRKGRSFDRYEVCRSAARAQGDPMSSVAWRVALGPWHLVSKPANPSPPSSERTEPHTDGL